MKCKICKKEIVLIPSATERARKFGGKPKDYTKLFTTHGKCETSLREQETKSLIHRISEN